MSPYPPEAVALCQRLYLRFNGRNYEAIEREMRKVYPGWSKKNLDARGKAEKVRMGWVEKYHFDKALEIHIAQQPTAALNSAQQLVIEIETIRALLYTDLKAQGAKVEKEKLQLHRDYCKLHIEALTRVEAAKDTLGGWVGFWERLIDWAPDIEIKLARALVKYSDPIIARAEKEFGESQETVAEMNANSDENQTDPTADAGTKD